MKPNLTSASRFVAEREPLASVVTQVQSFVARTVNSVAPSDNGAVLEVEAASADGDTAEARLEVTAVADGIIKVHWSRSGESPEAAAATSLLAEPSEAFAASVTLDGGRLVVGSGSLSAVIDLEVFGVRFEREDGTLVAGELFDDVDSTKNRRSLPLGWSETDKGVVWHETFRILPDEKFYGLGESFTPIEKTGTHTMLWTADTFGTGSSQMYKPVPYLYSTAGYAVLVSTGAPMEFDIAATSNAAMSMLVPDKALEYYLIGGTTPGEALQRSRILTGRLELPPRWAFGSWMSTGFLPQTQESVLAQARELRRRDFPGDVIHIDPYWMRPGRWCDLIWDDETFPDPKAMFAELRQLGLRTCLWLNPYVSIESPRYADAAALGYFLTGADGEPWAGQIWGDDVPHPPVAIVDFTNPEACEWYAGLLRSVLNDGAAVFKTDFGEAIPAETMSAAGLDGTALHNIYPLLYNDLVADITEEVTGDRVVWGRSSYLGGQRHVAQWGGDTPATWDGMANSLRGGLSYGMSGYSFWAHDIGGYDGRPTPELFRQWASWGAVSPLTRLHGTSSRIPWEWDEVTRESVLRSLRARYRLLPYIWSESVASAQEGLPLAKPLPLAIPNDPSVADADSCYMFGQDLLVAPARDENGSQLAYLSQGDWLDIETGERFGGGRWIRRQVASGDLPVLVRDGAIIPTVEGLSTVPEGPFQSVGLEIWGSGGHCRVIHDTNGSTTVTTSVKAGVMTVELVGPLDVRTIELCHVQGIATVEYMGIEHRLPQPLPPRYTILVKD